MICYKAMSLLTLKGEEESCALSWPSFRPNASAMAVNDLLRGCQSHAISFKLFLGMEALKGAEELFGFLHIEAGAIVADETTFNSILNCATELDDGILGVSGVFPGIA